MDYLCHILISEIENKACMETLTLKHSYDIISK